MGQFWCTPTNETRGGFGACSTGEGQHSLRKTFFIRAFAAALLWVLWVSALAVTPWLHNRVVPSLKPRIVKQVTQGYLRVSCEEARWVRVTVEAGLLIQPGFSG